MTRSYTIKDAKNIFLLVTPRGSFARSPWGDTWTRTIDGAHAVVSLAEAERAAKQINTRLGKKEVQPSPIFEHMKLCWGFDYFSSPTECVQKYFPRETEVISELPNTNPDAMRYHYPQDKAFSDPKIAWEHLKAKRLSDLPYAQQSLKEITDDLAACDKNLNPNVVTPENVVDIKGKKNE